MVAFDLHCDGMTGESILTPLALQDVEERAVQVRAEVLCDCHGAREEREARENVGGKVFILLSAAKLCEVRHRLLRRPILTALREMWISSSVGGAYTEFFSIIAQIRIFYVENFGLMARGRRRPEDGFR